MVIFSLAVGLLPLRHALSGKPNITIIGIYLFQSFRHIVTETKNVFLIRLMPFLGIKYYILRLYFTFPFQVLYKNALIDRLSQEKQL